MHIMLHHTQRPPRLPYLHLKPLPLQKHGNPFVAGCFQHVQGMLEGVGLRVVRGAAPDAEAERISDMDAPSLGLALAVFKAAQLIEMGESTSAFANFTAVDLETTDLDPDTADIIEVAAVRVRDGRIADTFSARVRPTKRISAEASSKAHGLTENDLIGAPAFAEAWPQLRAFCGDDLLVAHNGCGFDFPILSRMARGLGSSLD
jgi:hypothetical protein